MRAGAGFSALIAVGGKPIELERLTDTLESLVHYEPEVERVVVIDDFRGRFDVMAAVPASLRARAVVLPNPRNGRGCGWGGGLAAGILHGLSWCAKHAPGRFVLKFDTDSLVVAPFAERVAARFGGTPEVGLLGTYARTPRRELTRPEDVPAKPALRKLQRWLTVWRRTHAPRPHIQCALFPRARRVRATIRAAVANGYELGRHCQGGAYAVSARALAALAAGGHLSDPLAWLWTPCSEDIVVTVCVVALGLLVLDFNGDGEPFGVQAVGLADAPQRLVERGYGIIHSVKDHGERRETETRAFFRARRAGAVVASTAQPLRA